jgi:hypothetical protein
MYLSAVYVTQSGRKMAPFGSATYIVNTQLEIFKKQKALRHYKFAEMLQIISGLISVQV